MFPLLIRQFQPAEIGFLAVQKISSWLWLKVRLCTDRVKGMQDLVSSFAATATLRIKEFRRPPFQNQLSSTWIKTVHIQYGNLLYSLSVLNSWYSTSYFPCFSWRFGVFSISGYEQQGALSSEKHSYVEVSGASAHWIISSCKRYREIKRYRALSGGIERLISTGLEGLISAGFEGLILADVEDEISADIDQPTSREFNEEILGAFDQEISWDFDQEILGDIGQ